MITPGEDCAVQNGSSANFQQNGGVVEDMVTQLAWLSVPLTSGSYSAPEAQMDCAADMTDGRIWDLPTLFELMTIADYTSDNPASYAGSGLVIPGTFGQRGFWTSDTRAGLHYGLLFRGLLFGGGVGFDNVTADRYGRCVSRPNTNAERIDFCVDEQSRLVDQRTGLAWRFAPESSPVTWTNALTVCDQGWRLPTIKELISIFDPDQMNRLPAALQHGPNLTYWSSTTLRSVGDTAWIVDYADPVMTDPFVVATTPRDTTHAVRCVQTVAP